MTTHELVLIWIIVAGIGIVVSSYLSIEAGTDLWALRGEHNGRRLRVIGRLSAELIRLLVHAAFFYIGVKAIGHVSDSRHPDETIFVLVFGNVAFILNSLVAVYVLRRADFPPPSAMSAADLATRAEEAARVLLSEAHGAAQELLDLAAVAASERARVEADRLSEATERSADANERLADATERIAEQEEADGDSD